MTDHIVQAKPWVRTLLLLLCTIPFLVGLSGLLGWTLNKELLTSFGVGLVPMSPITAITFLVLSTLFIINLNRQTSEWVRVGSTIFTILIILLCLILLIFNFFDLHLDFEHLWIPVTVTQNSPGNGHMSPVTAFLFLCLSLSFLVVRISSRTTFTVIFTTSLAGFTVLSALTLFTAYIAGKPLFYGLDIVPPALNTSFSMLCLGAACTMEAFLYEKLGLELLSSMDIRFMNVFEHSAEGRSMIFPDGRFQANKALAEMLGYEAGEMSRITWIDITHPEDIEKSRENMDRMISEGTDSWRFEKRYLHKDGHTVWVDLQSFLQRDRDGHPLYFVNSISDISDYKIIQEQLIKAKDLAERSNHLKDAFIANMSHEIRTPLNAIIGFSDLIHEEMVESGNLQYESYFDIIRSSGSRLMRTVDMILNTSRLQLGEYEARLIKVDLAKMLENLANEYRLPAGRKGLSLDYFNELENPFVTGDEYCILHAVSNLIDNAIKYTNHGGIRLSLYRKDDATVGLDVLDTGIGISEDFLSEIFQPFTQEENTFTRQFEGIGLGLSIANSMLRISGSTLAVKSTKGVGTVFTITFPAAV